MLVEEGMLALDDPVEKHIFEFKGQKVRVVTPLPGGQNKVTLIEPRRSVNVRDILNHTHGIPKTLGSVAATSVRDRALAAGTSNLQWDPGTRWKYGAEGIHTAAYLVEKYSGMQYTEFLKEKILDPLGMNDTYFHGKDVPVNRFVTRYTRTRDAWVAQKQKDFGNGYFRPDGGLYATAHDLFVWYQTIPDGGAYGERRILSEA